MLSLDIIFIIYSKRTTFLDYFILIVFFLFILTERTCLLQCGPIDLEVNIPREYLKELFVYYLVMFI